MPGWYKNVEVLREKKTEKRTHTGKGQQILTRLDHDFQLKRGLLWCEQVATLGGSDTDSFLLSFIISFIPLLFVCSKLISQCHLNYSKRKYTKLTTSHMKFLKYLVVFHNKMTY